MRNVLFIILGAFLMFILLKILSSRGMTGSTSGTSKAMLNLLMTQQASNLVRTNEFRELIRTTEFQRVLTTLATNEINTLSKVIQL